MTFYKMDKARLVGISLAFILSTGHVYGIRCVP